MISLLLILLIIIIAIIILAYHFFILETDFKNYKLNVYKLFIKLKKEIYSDGKHSALPDDEFDTIFVKNSRQLLI